MYSIITLFNQYPILKEISETNKIKIKNSLVHKKFKALQYIKSVGNTCEGVPFVIKGEINIYKVNNEGHETNLYNMKPNDFCHESLSCILKLSSLDIVAQAVYDSDIIIIPIDIFNEVFLSDINFIKYIYIDLYENFKRIIEEKEGMLHEPLDKRLWTLLISSNSKYIYTTHESLAKKLCTSREVISRKLKLLEKSGKLILNRGKIEILKIKNT